MRTTLSGQALIEFIVGLVVVLALSAGLIQIVGLAAAHTNTMVEARRLAGEQAMLNADVLASPALIRDVKEGPDAIRYTKDDTFTPATAADFDQAIVNRAGAENGEWDVIDKIGGNRLSRLHGNAFPAAQMGLVRGYAHQSTDVIGAVRELLYRANRIDVETTVWMTQLGNLY